MTTNHTVNTLGRIQHRILAYNFSSTVQAGHVPLCVLQLFHATAQRYLFENQRAIVLVPSGAALAL